MTPLDRRSERQLSERRLSNLSLFETMMVVDGRVVLLDEHYARMATSCVALELPVPTTAAFRTAVTRAATDEAVRCTYIPGRELEATAFQIPNTTRSRREHGRALTLDRSWQRTLPEHKATDHYDVCIRALQHAVANGADEALFVDHDGRVLEGTATNVFAVRGTTLITAPIAAGVLPGIMRAWVLAQGFAVEERAPAIDELREGAFFTGSLTGIVPVRSIDGMPCAPPSPLVHELNERFTILAANSEQR